MSLHTLANHMAAQGRNNDSMLVHMTPREVNGLHALAVANGGSLTTNPETGLPEAGFLEDLLPTVIGFGLDTFVPGLGEAVGGALGLSGAAGTGIAVGGLTGLATGSLSKGVMAGFGAYGGAGLAEGLMGAGADAATKTAAAQLQGANETAAASLGEYANPRDVMMARTAPEIASLSPMDKLTAGFSATTQNPAALGAFAKDNWKNFVAAGAPALMGLSTQDQTVTKMPDDRMITPFVMNQRYVPRNESLSPSAQQRHITYGVTPITPVHAANGGAVSTFDDGGSVGRDAYGREVGDPDFGKPSDRYEGITVQGGFDRYGNLNGTDAARRAMLNSSPPSAGADNRQNGDTDEYTRLLLNAAAPRRTYQNTMTGDSAKAYDYLMGYTPATTTTTNRTAQVRAPGVALTTAAPAALTTDQVGAITSRSGHAIDAFGYGNPLANGIPGATTNQYGDSGPTTGLASLANSLSATLGNWGNDVNPATGLKDTGFFNTISNALARNIDPNYGHEAAVGMRQAAINAANTVGNTPGAAHEGQGEGAGVAGNVGSTAPGAAHDGQSGTSGDGSGVGRSDPGSAHSGQGAGAGDGGGGDGGGVGRSAPGSAHGDARGGFLNHGQFDQRYAYGGGIDMLAGGGLGSLGGYSDGGRLLRGPGDGVSDSIPATIGQHQPARLADGEFVVPARIVSELGNGSTEAGARQLYAMMDRIQAGRKKTMGKNKVAANSRAAKHLPA